MGPQDGLTLGVSVCAGVFMETLAAVEGNTFSQTV